jgi:hypothetical protein
MYFPKIVTLLCTKLSSYFAMMQAGNEHYLHCENLLINDVR